MIGQIVDLASLAVGESDRDVTTVSPAVAGSVGLAGQRAHVVEVEGAACPCSPRQSRRKMTVIVRVDAQVDLDRGEPACFLVQVIFGMVKVALARMTPPGGVAWYPARLRAGAQPVGAAKAGKLSRPPAGSGRLTGERSPSSPGAPPESGEGGRRGIRDADAA